MNTGAEFSHGGEENSTSFRQDVSTEGTLRDAVTHLSDTIYTVLQKSSPMGDAAFEQRLGEAGLSFLASHIRGETDVARPERPDADYFRATPQQFRVLELTVEGLSNKEIAERMFLAESTVKNYRTGLFAAMNVESAGEATAVAVRAGLLPRDPSDT